MKRRYNKLTQEEEKVIIKKGTESPFVGEYDDHFEKGVYLCRRCNSFLYKSEDKFNAGCGWPSFDDEIDKAVKRIPDKDRTRTEIICSDCGAHLGHVFTGEKLTLKNTRHCVNSLSLRFIPLSFKENQKNEIVLGGGCFWCLDAAYRMIKGIDKVISGYAGGEKNKPNYEEVQSGNTGHAEVVKLAYDPQVISFKKILEIFFSLHDPTTANRQGSDMGEQYRSIILYQVWNQKEEAESFIAEMENKKVFKDPIVTELVPLITFYPAEDYHQNYYTKNPDKPYCQQVIDPKVKKTKDDFQDLIE